jgi:hypothetical protein
LIECPVCGLLNPDGTARCECGFDFHTHMVITATREMSVTEVGNRTISRGVVVVVGGVVALGLQYAVMTSGGSPDRFLSVYALGAFLTLALGLHQIIRGFVLRARARKL